MTLIELNSLKSGSTGFFYSMTGVSVLVSQIIEIGLFLSLWSRIDRDSGDSWKCHENPINGDGVGGKILILSIAMNWSHKSFEV